MKLSNLIFTFILALITSLSLQSQSNVREIVIENDEENIYIKIEDGSVTELKIDGNNIKENDYPLYQHLLEKYESRTHEEQEVTLANPRETDLQVSLHKALKSYLAEKAGMDTKKYKFKLTRKYIKVNGKKLNKEILKECINIFEELAEEPLTKDSHFEVKVTPNSRSISLSIED